MTIEETVIKAMDSALAELPDLAGVIMIVTHNGKSHFLGNLDREQALELAKGWVEQEEKRLEDE